MATAISTSLRRTPLPLITSIKASRYRAIDETHAMGRILKGLVICHTNDFGGGKNGKIQGWIESNGGVYSEELGPNVTHVIASKKAWRRYIPLVREARRKKVRIVSLDWLEDSLMARKPKKMDERGYYFEQSKLPAFTRPRSRQAGAQQESSKPNPLSSMSAKQRRINRAGIQFDQACKNLRQEYASAGFHPYQDLTGFTYSISLVRTDILRERKEKHQVQVETYFFPHCMGFSSSPVVASKLPRKVLRRSHVHINQPWAQSLQLFESDSAPHTYALISLFTQSDRVGSISTELIPVGSTWDLTWKMFCDFFRQRTGKEWIEEANSCCNSNLDDELQSDKWFKWTKLPNREQIPCGTIGEKDEAIP